MSRLLLLLLAGLLLAPRLAWAALPGIPLYENGEYEQAVQAFEDVLSKKARLTPEEQPLALIYLAASLHALGRLEEARKHLETLAREYPQQRVDTVRFLPELVALAEVIRQQVEAEREFAARSAELEQRMREEALLRPPPPPPILLRPEVTSLVDAVSRQWTVGAGVGFQRERLEVRVHVLMGSPPAFQLQGGVLLSGAAVKPFLGLRASLLPGLESYGGGPVVGLRFALPARLVALVDVGADYFFIGNEDRYRFALTAQAGLGFNVRL